MPRSEPSFLLAVVPAAFLLGAVPTAAQRTAPAPDTASIRVEIITDEADAALDILAARRAGRSVSEAQWAELLHTEGYRRLQQRETSMGRSVSDADFKAFLLVDSMAAREPLLRKTVDEWRRADMRTAGAKALAYLPAGARIRARVYLTIKPRPNSFVFETNTNPAIFLFVDPARTRAQLENTVAHELHHIGYSGACAAGRDSSTTPAMREVLQWMGAFGEGLAMLGAAGGPDIHPHAVSPPADRARWDSDIANVADGFRQLDKFFLDVLTGRMAQPDSIQKTAMSFFGIQGPWYTVGWTMARTIEVADGRAALVRVICRPAALVRAYGPAADRVAGGSALPRWSDALLQALPMAP